MLLESYSYLWLIAMVMQTKMGGNTDVPGDHKTLQREAYLLGTLNAETKIMHRQQLGSQKTSLGMRTHLPPSLPPLLATHLR